MHEDEAGLESRLQSFGFSLALADLCMFPAARRLHHHPWMEFIPWTPVRTAVLSDHERTQDSTNH